MKQFDDLVSKVTSAKADADKFDAGNNTAGVRLRKAMKEVIDMAKDVRKAVVEVRKDV
jgi:hypothetical protein